jgi:hypothetical protein
MFQEAGPERGVDVTTKRVELDRKVGHLEGGVGTGSWMIEVGPVVRALVEDQKEVLKELNGTKTGRS